LTGRNLLALNFRASVLFGARHEFLFDPSSYPFPLLASGEREHHGNAHASALRSNQHCLTFSLSVSPRCRVFSYRDHYGNNVQHFDIPGEHDQLVIVAESLVEQQIQIDVPGFSGARRVGCAGCHGRPATTGEMLLPSTFAVPTPALLELAASSMLCAATIR
jgi:transglutaminase-like putative cysteine protease